MSLPATAILDQSVPTAWAAGVPVAYELLKSYLEAREFPPGALILREGTAGDGCFLIDTGEVRLEVERPETDTDGVLGFLGSGEWLGELNLLDGAPRAATAYAHTAVTARWLSTDALARLCAERPAAGLRVMHALGGTAARKLRHATRRLAVDTFDDSADPEVEAIVSRAIAAQATVADWPEDRVDHLLGDIAGAVAARAQELAEQTVAETRLGDVASKTAKNRFASLAVFESLQGRAAAGPIHFDEARGIVEIASPVGVVFGLVPLTNPVATFVFKALIALKGRNALILSCHRGAQQVGNVTGELIQAVLARHGAPVDLVQWVRHRASRRTTVQLMRHPGVAFILATGGVSMVRAAYSSGTPAIGVGPGNAPAWICADANLDTAAGTIVESKSFDHGIICGSENNLVVDAAVRGPCAAAIEAHGAAVLSPAESERFTAGAFDVEGRLRRDKLGQSAERLAAASGIKRPWMVRLIVVPAGRDAVYGGYGREKLAPVLSLFETNGDDDGIALCQKLLAVEGLGHTAIVHTQDQTRAERFGREVAASRILVNGPGSQGCIGLGNGLVPSLTLGCGTFGRTSTTDNVTYTHLLNIKRIAYAVNQSDACPNVPA